MRIWRIETLWVTLTFLVLLLGVWWIPGSASVKSDSYSSAFPGKRVFYQAMQRLGTDVHRSTDELIPRPGFEDRILILGPARYPSEQEWDELFYEVLDGATLVFAASATDPFVEIPQFGLTITTQDLLEEKAKLEELQQQGIEVEVEEDEAELNESFLDASSFSDLEDAVAETELVDHPVTWKSNAIFDLDSIGNWEVLLSSNDHPQVVRQEVGMGTVLFCTSDEIFSNGAMVDSERALLAFRIVEATPVWGETFIDETLNSSGVPKVVGILFTPAFRPITLQLILIGVLFGWIGARRFGPVYESMYSRRRSIVEHANALGVLYFRAHAGAHSLESMYEFLKLELRSLYGNGFRVDDAAAVARQVRMEPAEVAELLKAVKMAIRRGDAKAISNAEAGRLLKQLSFLISRLRSDS